MLGLRDNKNLLANTTSSQIVTQTPARRMQSRLFGALQILLSALIIFFLTKAALAFFAPESLWDAPDPVPTMTATNQAVRNTRLDTSFDPFHRDQLAQDEIIEIGTDAPETTLNLKLFGRRAGNNGTAILETPDKTQKVFRIGDEIISGVILKAVNTDYIVLSQSGRIERLTFGRDEDSLLAPPLDNQDDFASPSLETLVATSAQDMSLNQMMAGINLSPSMKDGQLQGFRVLPKSGDVNLTALGLKFGDVVSAIDDIDLTSPSLDPAQLPAQLAGKKSVRLTVLRGSETIFVTLGS